MTTTEAGAVPVQHAAEGRRRRSAGVVWVLLVAHLVAVTAVLLTAQRPASLGELTRRVESGEVDAVAIRGGVPPGSTGFSMVEVSWSDGLFRRVTEVGERRTGSDRAARTDRGWSTTLVDDTRVPVVRGSVERELVSRQAGLEVARAGRETGWHGTVLGLRVHGPLAPALMALVLADLLLLDLGPEPVRATRWAWAWLLLSPAALVVGVALLLVGGYLRLVPRPAPEARRLTGGWAFLLLVVLMPLSGAGR